MRPSSATVASREAMRIESLAPRVNELEDEDAAVSLAAMPRSESIDFSGASWTYLIIMSPEWRASSLILFTSSPTAAYSCAPVTRGVWPPNRRSPWSDTRGCPHNEPMISKVKTTERLGATVPFVVGKSGDESSCACPLLRSHWM